MKTIGWNVETQIDFMLPGGSMYSPGAETIMNNLHTLTQFFERQRIQVVNSGDLHRMNSKEVSYTPDWIKTFPHHCMEHTLGASYIPATMPKDPYVIHWAQESFSHSKVLDTRNLVLYKDGVDAFAGDATAPHADKVLDLINPDRAIVYGLLSEICVDYAVMGHVRRKTPEIYVPKDAIRSLPGADLGILFKKWEDKGVVLTTVDDIVKMYEP